MPSSILRVLASALLLLIPLSRALAADVYQIYYSDKPLRAPELAHLEKMYGTKLVVLPTKGNPPAQPQKLKGVVLHSDPVEDPQWVIGDRNPALDGKELNASLADRWTGEATLLKNHAPELYPETELARKFLPDADLSKLEDRIQALEKVRASVNDSMGKSILKSRTGFGSAGILPKTNDDWAELYRNYVKHTKPRILELEAKFKDADLLQDAISSAELPYLEGRVLDQVLEAPDQVLIQKMFPVDREIRVHVLEGKVLRGGTVNRFEYLGKYVTESELQEVERTIQKKFLDQLPADKRNLSATMDVIVSDGKFRVVDLNSGIESGMYYPENDLYVSNLLAERYSKKPTRYLSLFREFEAAPLNKKPERLRALVAEFGEWVGDEEASGLWDRVSRAYLRDLKKKPTPATYNKILTQLKEGRLRDTWVFHSLNAEVNDRWPKLKLSEPSRKKWETFLRRASDGFEFVYDDDGKIRVIPEVDYTDNDALKRAMALVREKENPEHLAQMTVDEISEHLRKGTLSDFFTPDRLKSEAPKTPWAETLSDLKREKAVFVEDGTFRQLSKRVLKKIGYFNKNSFTLFSRKGILQKMHICKSGLQELLLQAQ